METYRGSCHCGRVQFKVLTALTQVMFCDCLLCQKKGVLHHRVPDERFTLKAGHNSLTLYQFGTRRARHWFCRYCGLHPFSSPPLDEVCYDINVRCLDNYDISPHTFQMSCADIEIRPFDGESLEERFWPHTSRQAPNHGR